MSLASVIPSNSVSTNFWPKTYGLGVVLRTTIYIGRYESTKYTSSLAHQTWNWVIESPGQLVIWVIFHVRVTGSSFLPGVRPEFFRFSKKNDQNAKRTFEMRIQILLLTYLPCRVLEYSTRYSTEYSSSKKLDSHTPTHMSTFGVQYRTGSPGQLGLRVAGFPGHWVAGSQNVTHFHVCCR